MNLTFFVVGLTLFFGGIAFISLPAAVSAFGFTVAAIAAVRERGSS